MGQDEYLAIIGAYADRIGLSRDGLEAEAIAWSMGRGARSGRTAHQFITHKAAEQGLRLPF
jgi:predicted AAA+ superfamily ATPase